MRWKEQAKLLLNKAGQDEFVADKLIADPDSPLDAIGFHLQQAAEKLIKAALSFSQIPFPRTHQLGALIHLLRKNKINLPEEFEQLEEISPFAVEARYEFIANPFRTAGEPDLKKPVS